jgi:CheY-like chemotaxis protein
VNVVREAPVIVVIDDDETFVEVLTWWLGRRGFEPVGCTTDHAAHAAVAAHDVAAFICDIELGAGTIGTSLVAELRRQAGRDVSALSERRRALRRVSSPGPMWSVRPQSARSTRPAPAGRHRAFDVDRDGLELAVVGTPRPRAPCPGWPPGRRARARPSGPA